MSMSDKFLTVEDAEKIKQKIWQKYLESNLSHDLATAVKIAVDCIGEFVKEDNDS